MRFEQREGYRLWVGGPVPRGSAAITLGRLVIVRRGAVTSRLLRHEEVHVRQFRQVGPIRFITSYLVHYVRWRARGYSHSAAYRRIPLEVEAYWLERSEGHDASSSE